MVAWLPEVLPSAPWHIQYVCDIRGPCYSLMAHKCVSLVHRNYYDTHISDILVKVYEDLVLKGLNLAIAFFEMV